MQRDRIYFYLMRASHMRMCELHVMPIKIENGFSSLIVLIVVHKTCRSLCGI